MIPAGEEQLILVEAGDLMDRPESVVWYKALYWLHPAEPVTVPLSSKRAVISVPGRIDFDDPAWLKAMRYHVVPVSVSGGGLAVGTGVWICVAGTVVTGTVVAGGWIGGAVHPQRKSRRTRIPAMRAAGRLLIRCCSVS
jgi:hypothetical protein